tara:strand:+ start:15197 stop:18505 length:3309 start_codon:yes stop_codon:yes gene_type:complete
MRIFTNARGVPPKLRATTIRAFAPDKDYSSFGGIKDLLSTKELGFASTPTTTADCPVSGARVFDGTNYAYDSAASGDHASLTGECTWQAWVYIDSVQVKNSAYAFSYSASSETSATNIMLSIKVASSGGTPATLRSFWEYGSGSNQEAQSDQKPPTDEWCHIAMVREDDPDNAGKCRMKFYINGCQTRDSDGALEVFDNSGAGYEYPTGGSSARWTYGNVHGATGNYFTGRVGPATACSEALTDADIQEDYRRGLGWATGNRAHVRVLVEDNFGNMQDLSKVPSPDGGTVDMLQGVRIDDSVDKRVTTGTVSIFRAHGRVNLSPLMSESYLNRATAANTLSNRTYPTQTDTSYTAPTAADPTTFLNIGRSIKIQMSRMPYGLYPDEVTSFSDTGSDWYNLLVGYVDVVDFGKDVISINIRDQGALLADAFIEADDDESDERFVPDNTSLYDAIDNVVDENWKSPFGITSHPVLYEPVGADWLLSEGTIARDLVLSAINKLASQIAWMVRYKWDKGFGTDRQDFRLTLHEPDREKVLADSFISADDYVDLSKLSLDISGVRNAVKIAYYALKFDTTLPLGRRGPNDFPAITHPSSLAPVQNTLTYEDPESISKYGRRYMELQESAEDLIDSSIEAARMGNGILNDLKEPLAHTSLNAKDLVEVELNDMLSIEANDQSFDSDQNYAVSTINMDMKNGFVDVSFGLRGTPSSGSNRHISMQRTSNTGPQAPFSARDGTRPTLTALMEQMRPLEALGAFGGQDPAIPNQGFEQWGGGHGGNLSEPIGWTTTGGTWGSADDVYVKAIGDGAVTGQTGSFLIDLTDAAGAITSEFFAIRAGVPYVIKLRAATTNIANTVGGTISYYLTRKDTSAVSTASLSATALSAIDLVEEKQFYVTAPSSGVAFARVEISPGSVAASSSVYLDMVRLTECEPFLRATTAGYQLFTTGKTAFDEFTKINLDSVTLDIGDNFTGGPAHQYVAPEDGLYEVSACVDLTLVADSDPSFSITGTTYSFSRGGHGISCIVRHNSDRYAVGQVGAPLRYDLDGTDYSYSATSSVTTKLKMNKGDTIDMGYAGLIYFSETGAAFSVNPNSTFLTVTLLNGEKR